MSEKSKTPQTAADQPKAGITIDMAGAMEKITPEMLLAVDKMMADVLMQRLKEAETVFSNIMLALSFADPKVLTCTLWMPESIEKNCTVFDYVALAKQRLCHPDTETDLVPCHDENCDRHGEPHFTSGGCEN